MDRQRWNSDRRRKQPSLYDEYLSEERAAKVKERTVTPDQVVVDPHTTIRAVSPDSAPENLIVRSKTTKNSDREYLSLSSSPSSSSPRSLKKERVSPRIGIGSPRVDQGFPELAVLVEGDNAGNMKGQRRPRTRTLQDSKSTTEEGPSRTLLHKGRLRVGSLPKAESSTISPAEKDLISKEKVLASSLSQPAFSSVAASGAAGIPNRPKSSASTSASSAMSGPLPSPNARRILHLMKTLCGRMSGHVAYRRDIDDPWTASYCYIKEEEGSFMAESELHPGGHVKLLTDLRSCQVKCLMEEETQKPYLDITTPTSSSEVHLRISKQSDLDAWFAALLCWQPIRPKGARNRMAKPQAATLSARPLLGETRHNSDASLLKEAPVIKVGRMIFWDTDVSFPAGTAVKASGRPGMQRMYSSATRNYGCRWWRRVSCTLRENGELKLFTEAEDQLISIVQLSRLNRCAIQRLDPSVLDSDSCIAIYPQYTTNQSIATTRPIFLSLETRILYEVWFVLLRAFTTPQLYGPNPPNLDEKDDTEAAQRSARADMFRVERVLSIRIVEARLQSEAMKNSPDPSAFSKSGHSPKLENVGGLYAEIHLDGEMRAKTRVKSDGLFPFWRQDFHYLDLPPVLSSACVFLKHRPPDYASSRAPHDLKLLHDAHGLIQTPQSTSASSGYTGMTQDTSIGKVDFVLEELEAKKEIEQWWPITNAQHQRIGEILIRARAEENTILMRHEYEPISQLLHSFGNNLTVQIALAIPSDLKRLTDILLNIFQVSGRATDWIMALVEDEIDGVEKETPLSRIRYSRRMNSVDHDSALGSRVSDREIMVRDANKNAALEANLLFRGNTVLTKSLDAHMRRVGGEYLAAAIGPIINTINERDPVCEVDPNRVSGQHELERNWNRLLFTTEEVWKAINASAQKCPVELRFIFRHIKACAEDRYGDFLRTVSYSSVSGFLFLRFFCPAILNPKLFDLLKDDPKPRARRTFTLIAKSLQTLANMATFGSKEHWMEPMNTFLSTHRESFKKFVEDVCFVPHPPSALAGTSPSYSTPNAIRSRLPTTSREGFPSLPYLIDEARELASLIELWLSPSNAASHKAVLEEDPDSPLVAFHEKSTLLYERTQDLLKKAERAERPSSDLSFRWEELIETMQGAALVSGSPILDTDGAFSAAQNPNTEPTSNDATTPTAQVAAPHVFSSSAPSPHRLAQQLAWESAPDGGAASAAASLLSQDRNPRSGFILASPSVSSSPTIRSSAFSGEGHAASAAALSGQGSASRPGSALSGRLSSMSSDAELDTALPSVGRERTRRDRMGREELRLRELKERERERERARLKGLVGGLGIGLGMGRRRERERGE